MFICIINFTVLLVIFSVGPSEFIYATLLFQAYNCYLDALGIQPTFAIAWSNLAGLFMEAGDLNRALQYYKVGTSSVSMHIFWFVWGYGLVA